jgi:PKD repeat protein
MFRTLSLPSTDNRVPAMLSRSLLRTAASLVALLGSALLSSAQSPATGAFLTGRIDLLSVDHPNDTWSSGTMVVAGQLVILPRNLIIQLPANWLTVQQLFDEAPPSALAKGVTGLAKLDGPEFDAGFATVHGNRNSFGNLIAGDVFIQKGTEIVNGVVTLVNTTAGYVRIDGIVGDDTTGLMIRINDPESRHTIQQGAGCDGSPNCSPDTRFALDPDNYTITFATGYPAGIPSVVPVGLRPGFRTGDNPNAKSDASGVGDPFCPSTNRGVVPVPDSTRFAPIQVGDSLTAEGNFEVVAGVRFLSCHTMTVNVGLTTQDLPTQPDYMTFDEAEWDVPSFDNQRVRMLLIGFTTLNDSQLDIFRLHIDPRNNTNHEVPLGSTVNNPNTINQGIIPGGGGIFKINYDADFVALIPASRSPCQNLINAGFGSQCPSGGTLAENIAVLVPITREVQGRTRHSKTLLPGVITRDINGQRATNGQYLTPVGVGFPEFVEINLAALQTPFSFDGVPWNLDRRLSPVGCNGNCESSAQPLDPFPWSGRDPSAMLPGSSKNRPFQYYPFASNNLLAWPPAAPPAMEIHGTPGPGGPDDPFRTPEADFSVSVNGGTAPLTVAFTDRTQGNVNAHLWDFGDGSFSTDINPVHVYENAGTFNVALSALGLGGQDNLLRNSLIQVNEPGGGGTAPSAAFIVDRTAGNAPLAVQFTDASSGTINGWLWNFGDGATSNAQSPSHTYVNAGVFSVSLTVSGPGGSNSVTRVNLITANGPGTLNVDFTGSPLSGPAPLDVRFRAINLAGTALTGTFTFGDGASGTVEQGNGRARHIYTAPGTYTVTLTASDATSTDIEQKIGYVTVTAPLRQLR